MTPEQFCYWLQGRAELQPDNPPSAEEWQSIREHLAAVFTKVTPPLRMSPPGQWIDGIAGVPFDHSKCITIC
jgi:hypothetical protein